MLIKTPVRYNERSGYIMDADGNYIASPMLMSAHEDTVVQQRREAAEQIATALNERVSLLAQVAELTEALNHSPWTPIRTAEDLPKEDGVYLWTYLLDSKLSVRKVQLFTKTDGERCVGLTACDIGSEVIAWMPLPEPYTPPVNDSDDACKPGSGE